MQGQSTNQRSSRTTAGLRQYGCQRIFVSCPSTMCILDLFVFLVVFALLLRYVKHVLPFLPVVYLFLCFCSCLCPHHFLLPLSLPLFFLSWPLPLPGLHFSFSSVPDHPPTCNSKFHTMTSFFGTFDVGSPSPTNPQAQAVCFFGQVHRFRSLSPKSSTLSADCVINK